MWSGASPPALRACVRWICPLSFLKLCHAQTCGKCVPCRIGLGQLTAADQAGAGRRGYHGAPSPSSKRPPAASSTPPTVPSAVTPPGWWLRGWRASGTTMRSTCCTTAVSAGLQNPVPCVALCPAGVDIPGYMALVRRRALRRCSAPDPQGQPLPHRLRLYLRASLRGPLPPQHGGRRHQYPRPEALRRGPCRGTYPSPPALPPPARRSPIIGGGPSGLSCAYYLALMGHRVTVFEEREQLGGMLRYGIPSYRFPRELLDARDRIHSVHWASRSAPASTVGQDIWLGEAEAGV